MPSITTSAASGPGIEKTNRSAMAMVTTLFFMWGFLTVLNDILVPHFKALFDLTYTQGHADPVHVLHGLFHPFAAGRQDRRGDRLPALDGCGPVDDGARCLMFLPAASMVSYPLFLTALFVLAAGMTVLQVSSNPYVTVLGPPATASSRLNLAQAFNSLGTAIAPALGGMLILSSAPLRAGGTPQSSGRQPERLPPRRGFVAQAAVPGFRRDPDCARHCALALQAAGHQTHRSRRRGGRGGPDRASAWRVRHLVLGAAGIFLYCGAEVSIGSFLVNFFTQPDIGGSTAEVAAQYVSYYWGGAMIGRFIGSALLQRVPAGKLLGVYGLIASSLVWSPSFHRARRDVGDHLGRPVQLDHVPDHLHAGHRWTRQAHQPGFGHPVHGDFGRGRYPGHPGRVGRRIGIQYAFVLPAVCYLYVVFYGFKGCRH